MTDAKALLLVMQNVKKGSEEAHERWYAGQHLSDVCSVDGVIRGEYAVLANPDGSERWQKAAIYWLSRDPAPVLATVTEKSASGEWDLSGVAMIDRATTMMAMGEALTGRIRSAITPDASGKERLHYIVLTNSTPGDDDAFNHWYDMVHLTDVLAVPGFVAAQRFRLVDSPGLAAYPYRYCAIYEVLAREAEAAFAELEARAGTERMVLSPTLDMTDVHAQCFRVVESCAGAA